MYDFLFQEGFWMQELISAAITGAITLIVAGIAYFAQTKKEHNNLSGEHKDLSKEHKDLSKEHGEILEIVKDDSKFFMLVSKVDAVKEVMLESKTKDEMRYENLTDKQKDIVNSVNYLQQIAGEIKYLQESNTKLLVENQILSSKNQELAAENQTLRSRVDHIAKRMSERNQNKETSNDMEHEME